MKTISLISLQQSLAFLIEIALKIKEVQTSLYIVRLYIDYNSNYKEEFSFIKTMQKNSSQEGLQILISSYHGLFF